MTGPYCFSSLAPAAASAKTLPAPFGGRQRCFGALGDHLPLMLSNSSQDMHCELVGVGIIYGRELDPTFHQRGVAPVLERVLSTPT
jgi:hypothetical protein